MPRGVGAVELVQHLVPEWGAVAVALLTQLGDAWFIGLLLLTLYWRQPQHRAGIGAVTGAWIVGGLVSYSLKALFALPRPEDPLLDPATLPGLVQPLYEVTGLADGFGFPSGHAISATIVYLGLAWVYSTRSAWRRYGLAASVIVTVSVTRVALGVHYLVDVLAGVAIGLVIVGGTTVLFTRYRGDGRAQRSDGGLVGEDRSDR